MEAERILCLNDAVVRSSGRYVLYWMQQSQRTQFNPALEHAVSLADESDRPVVVVFGLFADYPEANERHFAFMLEGLVDVAAGLRELGIRFVVRSRRPDEACLSLAPGAALVVCDRGYLRHQKQWREAVAREAGCKVVQVEGDVVVPVDRVSDKREYAARTLRPKVGRLLDSFLGGESRRRPAQSSLRMRFQSDVDPRDPSAILAGLRIDRSVGRVARFRGGTAEAHRRLGWFLHSGLAGYAEARNDPADPQCSNLSPYLHFGQISPVEIARKARAARGGDNEDRAAFLEELIVRRELASNFVHFEPDYDRYQALPGWAQKTLAEHRDDARQHVYSRRQLEQAATHDPYWNAAMTEMIRTGYMHNYMRMYWGKKIIEWSNTPAYAYRTALTLNNKYFMDGRDPNSYTGVGWVFGLHDRPWAERRVFGTVRYMNAGGLERKFDIAAYVRWAAGLDR
ncbi:MAG: deoxyribodipyrimidine photolyase [Thiotrichales bacterium]|nr:deoxyribodipyrimidine photolyase [Thiotrichales bacterium]